MWVCKYILYKSSTISIFAHILLFIIVITVLCNVCVCVCLGVFMVWKRVFIILISFTHSHRSCSNRNQQNKHIPIFTETEQSRAELRRAMCCVYVYWFSTFYVVISHLLNAICQLKFRGSFYVRCVVVCCALRNAHVFIYLFYLKYYLQKNFVEFELLFP